MVRFWRRHSRERDILLLFMSVNVVAKVKSRQLNSRKLFVNLLWCIAFNVNLAWTISFVNITGAALCIYCFNWELFIINDIALRGVTLWKLVAHFNVFPLDREYDTHIKYIADGWLIAFIGYDFLLQDSRLKTFSEKNESSQKVRVQLLYLNIMKKTHITL